MGAENKDNSENQNDSVNKSDGKKEKQQDVKKEVVDFQDKRSSTASFHSATSLNEIVHNSISNNNDINASKYQGEVNITTFEKDSHSGYSTSFKHTPLEKEVGKKSNTASNPKRIRNAQETKEDVDVTDLTLAGKSTAPAVKSRSRKGKPALVKQDSTGTFPKVAKGVTFTLEKSEVHEIPAKPKRTPKLDRRSKSAPGRTVGTENLS